ncbi:MAG: LptF/LptG family permease [Pirellulales bacterium]
MRYITRYVLSEVIVVFGLALAGMTLFMILVGVVIEAVRQGLGPEPILRLVPYLIPNALVFAVPGALLFAVCTVYGRMSAANEIVAVKSLGISPMAMLWPGVMFAFFTSLSAVWLNDLAASWGREGIQRVIMESMEQIVYGTLRTHRAHRANDKLAITVRRVDGRKLINPTISTLDGRGRSVTITAREAELQSRPENNSLVLRLWDPVIETGDRGRLTWPGLLEQEIPLRDAVKGGDQGKHPTEYAIRQIPVEINSQLQSLHAQEQAMATTAACQLFTGDFTALSQGEWSGKHHQLRSGRGRLYRLHCEPYRRWANGFSCFFFVWVGAPLAVRLRNSDLMTTFGLVFLPILLLYYPLMAYGVDRAKTGEFPPYAVWIGNVILFFLGFYLLRRVLRY